jgi:plasmid stabilization system protein ParE
MEATDRLARFPESGRIIPEIGDAACREVVVTPYRIMHRLETDQVWITGIVHGARNWRPE